MIKALYMGIPNLVSSVVGTKQAPSPIHLQIEPTSRCNLNCKMCFRDECPYELNKDLSMDNFKRIMDIYNLYQIHLVGYGEPFLHNDIFEMIQYSSQKGVKTETTTNGTVFDSCTCKEIFDSDLKILNISIDGIITYQKIRGIPPNKVLNALNDISDFMQKNKSIEVNVITVVVNDNLEDLNNIVDAIAPYPVTLCLKTNRPNKRYKKVRQDHIVREALKRAKSKKLKVEYVHYKPTPFCYRIYFTAFVNTEGEVFACCNLFKPMGSLFSGGWNSERFQQFRNKFNYGFPPECHVCNLPFNQKLHPFFKWFKKNNFK